MNKNQMYILSLKKCNKKLLPINYNFRFHLRDRLTLKRISLLLKTLNLRRQCLLTTLFFATHINIITFDFSNLYHYKFSLIYKMFCYYFNKNKYVIKIYCFGK